MLYLKIHLIGFAASFLFAMLCQHLYYCDGDSRYITVRDIVEDFLASLVFSWLTLLLQVFSLAIEIHCGSPLRGKNAMLGQLEEELKQKQEEQDHE